MKKLIFTIVVLLMTVPMAVDAGEPAAAPAKESSTMWVCGGPNSKRYHKTKDCRGLNRCSKTPQKMTLKECQKKGYTACRICVK